MDGYTEIERGGRWFELEVDIEERDDMQET